MRKLNKKYNIEKLNQDRKFVEERFKYEDGAFGHCISLPSIYEIAESHRVTLLIDLKKNQWLDKFLSIFREL
jgi:hypothetical protein